MGKRGTPLSLYPFWHRAWWREVEAFIYGLALGVLGVGAWLTGLIAGVVW